MVAEKMAELGRHSAKIRQIAEYGREAAAPVGEFTAKMKAAIK